MAAKCRPSAPGRAAAATSWCACPWASPCAPARTASRAPNRIESPIAIVELPRPVTAGAVVVVGAFCNKGMGVIAKAGSDIKSVKDLKGKKVASGPGIQNVTLAKSVLERAGATGATVVELPIGQHVASLAAGQVDAAYTLEPTGTVGRMNNTTRVLEAGVISKYILGDAMAPWFGGSASLTAEFVKNHPVETKKFVTAYAKGIQAFQRFDSSRSRETGGTGLDRKSVV